MNRNQDDENVNQPVEDQPVEGDPVPANIPVAVIGPARMTLSDLLKGSFMWLVALGCLVVAIGIVWWSMPGQGIKITIDFPDGHGLEAEDEIRFRGICVGVVEEVNLNPELSGVAVTVVLQPFAAPLAREGTRFWIVRPELSLAGISGLETAVGHKYIGLIPGDPDGQMQTAFEGLAASPPDALENSGIEITVRGEKRHSVAAGSPVTYRGVVVGRVMAVGLSKDGRFVDARARIFDESIELVTTRSKFWASSGVDLEFSWTDGLKFNMDSIETLAHGGISVLTTEAGGQPIVPGHVFILHSSPDESWFELAQQVSATKIDLRGALPMEQTWEKKGLFRSSENRDMFVATIVSVSGTGYLMLPTDRLDLPDKATEGSLEIGLAGSDETKIRVTDIPHSESVLTLVKIPEPLADELPAPIPKSEFRIPGDLEACMAVRANGELGDLTYLHYAFEIDDITLDWKIKNFDGDRSVWHGAPVLSSEDGNLIGVLIVGEHETRIEILTEPTLESARQE